MSQMILNKEKVTENPLDDGNTKGVQVTVLLKYLNNF